ncbi:MAG: DNA polymerase III subunit gamma/tau [Chloroflexi bacterium]|nr:DNA polymerase III subunit gamma/tau [Chloroflexota bacterium]
MTTQVYYRKWRPQRLADVAGQEAVVRTLKQALQRQRIAHAYLFCGPRGTGKTSTARILAKAVNCLAPLPDGEPCNACRLCVAVNQGRALDLVEVDAASNRGIDEVRSIREKVQYAPAESKYKVYVLDEAHMLTDAAADALLKTLEEPPSHVIFVLATTEPEKLPPTITSRCQRFDFHRIAPGTIVERLSRLCAEEDIQAEPEALQAVAYAASGSLRDAENLLEQASVSFGSPLTLEQVRLLLGLAEDSRTRRLTTYLVLGQTREALLLTNEIASEGVDLRQLHVQLLRVLRDLLLLKASASEMVPQAAERLQEQQRLLAEVPLDRLLRVIRLLSQASFRQDVPGPLPLELVAVECGLDGAAIPRSTEEPALASQAPAIAQAPPLPPRPAPTPRDKPGVPQPVSIPSPGPVGAPPLPPEPAAGAAPSERLETQWETMVKALSRQKGRRFNLGALLRGCRSRRLKGDTLELDFSHRSHMERMQDEMENPESRRAFLETVTKTLGLSNPPNLVFTAPNGQQQEPRDRESPLVQAALKMGGRVLKEEKEGEG